MDFKLELAMIGPNFKKRSALARFTFCLFNQNLGVFMMDDGGWYERIAVTVRLRLSCYQVINLFRSSLSQYVDLYELFCRSK